MAVVACDAVLPNLREIIFFSRMHAQGHPAPATRSDTVKPRSPQKLRHADTGSTPLLTENPRRSSRGPSLSPPTLHRTHASGMPRSSASRALQLREGSRLTGSSPGPRGPRCRAGAVCPCCPGGGDPGSSIGAPGAGWHRAEQEDRGQGWLRLSGAKRDGLLLTGSRSCCREELRGFSSSHGRPAPVLPRADPRQRTQHEPLCAPSERRFSQAVRGEFGTGMCQTQDVSQSSASHG